MGSWFDTDGLYRQYGATKAIPTTAGEYANIGDLRSMVIDIDLTTLTTSPVIQDNVTFFPAGMFIEQVDVVTLIAATSGTTVSVGLVNLDRSTVLSNTAFVAALITASMSTAGEKTTLTAEGTYAGAYIGTAAGSASPGYITALAAGTYATGKIRVKISYRSNTTITQ